MARKQPAQRRRAEERGSDRGRRRSKRTSAKDKPSAFRCRQDLGIFASGTHVSDGGHCEEEEERKRRAEEGADGGWMAARANQRLFRVGRPFSARARATAARQEVVRAGDSSLPAQHQQHPSRSQHLKPWPSLSTRDRRGRSPISPNAAYVLDEATTFVRSWRRRRLASDPTSSNSKGRKPGSTT